VIWSGAEFEEHLRLRAEFLLRRLVEGVPFPDSEIELRNFVDKFQDVDDEQALAMFDDTAHGLCAVGEGKEPIRDPGCRTAARRGAAYFHFWSLSGSGARTSSSSPTRLMSF
jgi:hypothetical protein